MTEKTHTPRRFLFEGCSRSYRGGDRGVIRPFDADGNEATDGLAFDWKAKTFSALNPGWTYTMDAFQDGDAWTIKFGTARDGEPLADAERRQGIVILHRAALTSIAADRAAAKLATDDKALAELIRPLARHYKTLKVETARVAFEVAVVAALRKTRPFG